MVPGSIDTRIRDFDYFIVKNDATQVQNIVHINLQKAFINNSFSPYLHKSPESINRISMESVNS